MQNFLNKIETKYNMDERVRHVKELSDAVKILQIDQSLFLFNLILEAS
jgi:hypothetical protein